MEKLKKQRIFRRIHEKLSPETGMTLLEVVISIALLAIVTVILAQVMLTSIVAVNNSKKHTAKSVQVGGNVAANSIGASSDAAGNKIETSSAAGNVVITYDSGASSITVSGGTMVTGTITPARGGTESAYKNYSTPAP